MVTFKIRKPKTDVVSEAKAQQSGQGYVISSNDMKNGGINILEKILGDSLGVYRDSGYGSKSNVQEKIDSRKGYPDNNFQPGSEDQMNENKLDE